LEIDRPLELPSPVLPGSGSKGVISGPSGHPCFEFQNNGWAERLSSPKMERKVAKQFANPILVSPEVSDETGPHARPSV
jgi:hypothetical protein